MIDLRRLTQVGRDRTSVACTISGLAELVSWPPNGPEAICCVRITSLSWSPVTESNLDLLLTMHADSSDGVALGPIAAARRHYGV